MKKTLSVAAIENGTVIDHIPAGQGLHVVDMLKLADHKKRVALGLNLPSQSLGYKDLIKVEGREITEEEANQIAIFAPKATISIIRNYDLARKFPVDLPQCITKIVHCPNARCITNHQRVQPAFAISRYGEKVELCCQYCEKSFFHDACR